MKIRNNHLITKDEDAMFLEKFHVALLLALKEAEFLSEHQCENALKRIEKRR